MTYPAAHGTSGYAYQHPKRPESNQLPADSPVHDQRDPLAIIWQLGGLPLLGVCGWYYLGRYMGVI